MQRNSNLFIEFLSQKKNHLNTVSKPMMNAASVEIKAIDHMLIDCPFTKTFIQKVIHWFNTTKKSLISPTIEETLFGISGNSCDNSVIRKIFNYTFLVMGYYFYTSKLNNKAITFPELVNEKQRRYAFENICKN